MPPDHSEIITAERLTRLETKLDILIEQMKNLPPSPTCTANHRDHESRLSSLEAWRNKAIGVLLAANIVFILVIDKLKNLIWPS